SLVDAVDNTDNTTIFAPNNEAFNNLVKFTSDNKIDLTDALLKSTLTLHVIPGVVYSTDIPKVTAPVKALSGDLVTIKIENGTVLVSGEGNTKPAKVIKADVLHSKGVIHVIDTVLLQKMVGSTSSPDKPSTTSGNSTASSAFHSSSVLYLSALVPILLASV
ncbi:FAS1 domain-containing protein, partial [Globomyces pollinis-pini]